MYNKTSMGVVGFILKVLGKPGIYTLTTYFVPHELKGSEKTIMSAKESIFFVDVGINYLLLLGVVLSIGLPQKRVWPPPRKRSWQYVTT